MSNFGPDHDRSTFIRRPLPLRASALTLPLLVLHRQRPVPRQVCIEIRPLHPIRPALVGRDDLCPELTLDELIRTQRSEWPRSSATSLGLNHRPRMSSPFRCAWSDRYLELNEVKAQGSKTLRTLRAHRRQGLR